MNPEPPSLPPRSTIELAIPLAAVALGLLYLWGAVIPGVEAAAPRGFGPFRNWDLETYFLPKFAFGSEELLRGVLPVWNRYEFGGIPFLATAQPAAAYPPKILAFALFDPASALRVFLIAHSALLAAFFLIFARSRGIGPLGLLAGTLFWPFSHHVLLASSIPVQTASLIWVPLIFLLGERLCRSPSAAGLAGLAAIVALQVTAGYPEYVIDTGLLVALYAVVLYWSGELPSPPWKAIPLLAGAFAVGALVAAIQILPLLDLVLVSGRFEMAARIAAGVQSSIAALPTLGVPALIGFAIAAIGRRRAAPLAGLIACLFMFFVGWKLLRLAPGFSAVRLPFVWMVLLPFFLAWLVACGADRFDRGSAGPVGRWALGVTLLGWAALCVVRVCLPGWGSDSAVLQTLVPSAAVTETGSLLVSAAGLAGALMLAAYALGPVALREARLLAFLGIGLVLFGQISAYPFGTLPARFAPPQHPYRSASLIGGAGLQDGRVLSLYDARGGFHLLDRVENVFGREGSLPPPRFTALEKRLGVIVQVLEIRWPAVTRRRGLLETLDVRYLVGPQTLEPELERIGYHNTGRGDERTAAFEKRDRLGRAWGVYGVEVVHSSAAALDRVLARGFDPRRQVILEREPSGTYPQRAWRPPTPAEVRRPSPTTTEVEVDMVAPGVLVLADSCFPGWSVSVDGRPAELLCANFLVRGVELDAGHHLVRFEYRPSSLRWGAALSGVAGAVVVAVLLGALLRSGLRPTRKAGA